MSGFSYRSTLPTRSLTIMNTNQKDTANLPIRCNLKLAYVNLLPVLVVLKLLNKPSVNIQINGAEEEI